MMVVYGYGGDLMRQFITPKYTTADKIKSVRKKLGLTQKEFAEFIGVSKPTVERWEVSEKKITGAIVLLVQILDSKIAQSLEIPPKKYPLRLWYMYKDQVCTLIDVDELSHYVEIVNYNNNVLFRAFGNNLTPTFEDYQEFIESRCFPRERDKMKLILKDLNIPFYDTIMIIKKTEGRMAEDNFWIKIEL